LEVEVPVGLGESLFSSVGVGVSSVDEPLHPMSKRTRTRLVNMKNQYFKVFGE
jgi:hypothetical protein